MSNVLYFLSERDFIIFNELISKIKLKLLENLLVIVNSIINHLLGDPVI